jgi:hypothetical protein
MAYVIGLWEGYKVEKRGKIGYMDEMDEYPHTVYTWYCTMMYVLYRREAKLNKLKRETSFPLNGRK